VAVAANERRRNRMLEDELFQCAGFKHDRVFVERPYFAGNLHAIEQVHGDVLSTLERGKKKRFLNIAGKHDDPT
jgi:hypothetical protein